MARDQVETTKLELRLIVPAIEKCAIFTTGNGTLELRGNEAKQVGSLVRKLLEKRLKRLESKKIIPR